MAWCSNLSSRQRYFFKFLFSWLLQKRRKGSASKSEPHTGKEVSCPSTNGETITECQQAVIVTDALFKAKSLFGIVKWYVQCHRKEDQNKEMMGCKFPWRYFEDTFVHKPTNQLWQIEAKNISWPCCCGKSPRGSFYTLPKLTNLGIVGHSVEKKQSSQTSQICRCRWKW